jgi:hypothetical protein
MIKITVHDESGEIFSFEDGLDEFDALVTGESLAEVARLIAGRFEFRIPREKRKMFALICEGFNERAAEMKQDA